MRHLLRIGFNLMALTPFAFAQQETPTMHHARGTFTVAMKPLTPAPAEGLARYSIDKVIHGDLEATTKGEMFAGGDYTKGAAGYVAIEVVTGTLNGKHGSFALQQMGTMDKNGPKLTAMVVPGSGTGELTGSPGRSRSTLRTGGTPMTWSTRCRKGSALSPQPERDRRRRRCW